MQKARPGTKGVPQAKLPTRYGDFEIYGFENDRDGERIVAVVKGPLENKDLPLVRIHSQCLTGDIFRSLRCDCGDQLEQALERIAAAKSGVLVYQMQEGRGIGLMNKLHAYQLQDQGVDTVEANAELGFEADLRSYRFCAEILKSFGITRIQLMSNNPEKIRGLEEEGLEVVIRIPLVVEPSPISEKYLRTKKEKLGHLLD